MANTLRFVQREHGTTHGDVTFTGTRARIVDAQGNVVADWTTGGVIDNVPQGTGYVLEVENGGSTQSYELSIGIAISAMGQSNMKKWFLDGGVVEAAEGTLGIDRVGTIGETVGLAARIFTAVIAEITGAPVAILNSTKAPTYLTGSPGEQYWTDESPGSVYDRAKIDLLAVGGSAEIALWGQGESDGSPERKAAFRAGLYDLFARIARDFGDPLIVIQELAAHIRLDGTIDFESTASRIEDQNAVADALENVVIGADTSDVTFLDQAHLDNVSRAGAALHMAVTALENMGYTGISQTLLATAAGGTIVGGDTIDFIVGGAGADRLYGGAGRDELKGGANNDHLIGGGGDDVLRGQDGNDVILGGLGNDTIDGGLGSDKIRGGASADEIFGGDGNDILFGEAGENILWAGAGDDLMVAGLENERFHGGLGFDTVSFQQATAGVTVNLANAERQNTGGAGRDLLDSIEALVGSDFRDHLTGDGGANILDGRDGDDILQGGGGNDQLKDGLGVDILRGGSGDDLYIIVDSFNTLVENAGKGIDEVRVFGQNFTLGDNFENLRISAGAVNGTGNALDNTINGSSNANVLSGLDGDDTLDGKNGLDTLIGGNGDDILIGGTGRDTLTGGAGADRFSWRSTQEGNATLNSADTITDFSHAEGDKINLSGIDANTTNGAGNDEFAFIGTGAFSGVAGQLRYFASGTDTIVQMDVNGDGASDLSIRLTGTIALTASDFLGVVAGQAPLAFMEPVMLAPDVSFG